ncbi:MAG: hypothetical protein JNL85_07975 [Rubrivivax sp.]|nr:hypothetical protein [Rubrivivax sp.]
MGMLTAVLSVAGVFLVVLVAVAMVVAGWEWLRQREHLDRLRRDRACQAATSPLPLPAAANLPANAGAGRSGAAAAAAAVPLTRVQAARREGWIETRPMVLSPLRAAGDGAPAAVADATVATDATVAVGEPDLLLE